MAIDLSEAERHALAVLRCVLLEDGAKAIALLDAHPGLIKAGGRLARRALADAALRGQQAVVEKMLDAGMTISDEPDDDGECDPQGIASPSGCDPYEGVDDVYDASADNPEDEGDDALVMAVRGGHAALVRALLARGASAGPPAVDAAVRSGDRATLRLLVEHDGDVVTAAEHGFLDIVNAFLATKPPADLIVLKHMLSGAVYHGQADVARSLVEYGVPRGNVGIDALKRAGAMGYADVLRVVLPDKMGPAVSYVMQDIPKGPAGHAVRRLYLVERAYLSRPNALVNAIDEDDEALTRELADAAGEITAGGRAGLYRRALAHATTGVLEVLVDKIQTDRDLLGGMLSAAVRAGRADDARLLARAGADPRAIRAVDYRYGVAKDSSMATVIAAMYS